MASPVQTAPLRAADEAEDPGWAFEPGQPIDGGLHAWELLGDGERFETWLAWSTRHWSAVTVKLPKPSRLPSSRALASLHREADFLADLQHPSFQRLLEQRFDGPVPLIVCEYVEGPSLSSIIDDGPLSAIDAVLVGLQLASALHYLHQQRIVHLDLKPGNVLLRDGRVVIIDLGLARPAGSPHPPGPPRGTADYMAPEQCRRQPPSPRMDVFALGTILYELVTGARAFDNESSEPQEYVQTRRTPVPACDLVDDLPDEFEAVLEALLEPEPERRLPTSAAVLRALSRLIPGTDEGLWPPWAGALLG